MDLFDYKSQKEIKLCAPLADRMRPRTLEEYVGQQRIIGPDSLLRRAISNDQLQSIIFWGPPGSGKTTLAFVIANLTNSFFVELSAVTAGKKELLEIIEQAKEKSKYDAKKTILFIDEIHRWNKAQQDALLPYVERGVVTLIGATTENPSFEIIKPLLSRSRVYVLDPLEKNDLSKLIDRALADGEKGLGELRASISDEARELLLTISNGDARVVLNGLEAAVKNMGKSKIIGRELIEEAVQHKALAYDKDGEEHYNVISAFIKSIRGSSVDGALYWLARMIEAGEDPKFIARRMMVLASEDIGNADSNALQVANAVFEAVEKIGLPECRINLAQGVVYLCQAPKSSRSYEALEKAIAEVRKTGHLPVPLHLRNAPTGLMKELGYGQGYRYTHNQDDSGQKYLPQEIEELEFY